MHAIRLTCKVANKCLNVRERAKVVERNKKIKSEKVLGAVLYQEMDGIMNVLINASITLILAEKKYHLNSGKLIFLALKWSVTEKLQDYLYYAKEFGVYSDNNPLSYALSSVKLNAADIRWVSELSDFNFKINYRPGKKKSGLLLFICISENDNFD